MIYLLPSCHSVSHNVDHIFRGFQTRMVHQACCIVEIYHSGPEPSYCCPLFPALRLNHILDHLDVVRTLHKIISPKLPFFSERTQMSNVHSFMLAADNSLIVASALWVFSTRCFAPSSLLWNEHLVTFHLIHAVAHLYHVGIGFIQAKSGTLCLLLLVWWLCWLCSLSGEGGLWWCQVQIFCRSPVFSSGGWFVSCLLNVPATC